MAKAKRVRFGEQVFYWNSGDSRGGSPSIAFVQKAYPETDPYERVDLTVMPMGGTDLHPERGVFNVRFEDHIRQVDPTRLGVKGVYCSLQDGYKILDAIADDQRAEKEKEIQKKQQAEQDRLNFQKIQRLFVAGKTVSEMAKELGLDSEYIAGKVTQIERMNLGVKASSRQR